MVVSSVSWWGRGLGSGLISIVPLERLVAPSAQNLSTVRQQKKPFERCAIKHRHLQALPHRQLMTPTPSRRSQLSIRLHQPVPWRTNHHQVIRRIQKFRSTHPTILPMMRNQILLNPTMPTMRIACLHELEDFLRHRHKLSLYWVRAWMDSTGTQNGKPEGVRTGVRFSAGPQTLTTTILAGKTLIHEHHRAYLITVSSLVMTFLQTHPQLFPTHQI
jgi:hypothetical protein